MQQPAPSRLHFPAPITQHRAFTISRSADSREAARRLQAGDQLIVSDDFSTGQAISQALRRLLKQPPETADYPTRRAFKRTYGQIASRLLIPIRGGEVGVANGPSIGFIPFLYPNHTEFSLPYEEVRRLGNAWDIYKKGVQMGVLGYRIHPFYGTYAPTRTTHLELFATWLSQYEGKKAQAFDVGTGTGVLAFMLCKAGFKRVLATDSNPNAIESVRRERQRHTEKWPLGVHLGDLLEEVKGQADLIVFNPPWMMGEVDSPLDQALYYKKGLFERFFEQATQRLSPSGRLVLVFSNLIELVQPDLPHPIEAELKRGRFALVQKMQRRVKNPRQEDGSKKRTKERVQIWELQLNNGGADV